MRSSQYTTVVVIAAALSGLVAVTAAAAQTGPAPPTLADLARATAQSIEAGTPKTANVSFVFKSATSHDNVVDVRYVATDPVLFARVKANAELQGFAARYFCNASRVSSLNLGVVIHQVVTAPDNRDSIEFTIDRATCAALPVPKLADSKTLAAMAQAVAQAVNSDNKATLVEPNGLFQFDVATARDAGVDVHYIVADAVAGQRLNTKRGPLVGLFENYVCNTYGDDVRQGLSIHHIFTLGDGTAVFDFTVDRTAC